MRFIFIPLFVITAWLNPFKTTNGWHNWCTKNVNKNTYQFQEEKRALLCGDKIKSVAKKSLLIKGGLIHIFVVSGAHIQFYKNTLGFFFNKTAARFLILFLLPVYCVICNGSPPILRATNEHFMLLFCSKLKLNFTKSEVTFFSGLLCLIISPHLIYSIALLLSWVCSLIINRREFNIKTFIIFLVATPALLLFCLPNPMVTLPNLFLSFMTSFLVLPLAFLSLLLPANLEFLVNTVFLYFYNFLDIISEEIHINYFTPSSSHFILLTLVWTYTLLMNLWLIHKDKIYAQTQ